VRQYNQHKLTLKTAAPAARVLGDPGGVEAMQRVCKICDKWSLIR